MNENTPKLVSNIDPYVYQTLASIVGSEVVVQTTKGTVSGMLKGAFPDHAIVDSHGGSFFIRIEQIVWILPKG